MFQPDFDFLATHDAATATTAADARITRHIESMRCCWPYWQGPRVEDSIHGRCSVHDTMAENLTTGRNQYHYMAPCRIESVSPDGMEIIGVIDYAPGSTCAWMNGQRLRLPITNVWPVTDHDAY
jgi:hypothetical protein